MSLVTNRTINGLLKGFKDAATPESVHVALSRNIEIVAPPGRATEADLWPAIWALAAVAERQFFGRIYLRIGLDAALPAPAKLSNRCLFVATSQDDVALSIQLGALAETSATMRILGNAAAGAIGVGTVEPLGDVVPTALEAFALAGYVGFSALALLAGIPPHRSGYSGTVLRFPPAERSISAFVQSQRGFSVVGLGQLGQAYLALLYFLDPKHLAGTTVALFDDDKFQKENGRTQVLLADGAPWDLKPKVEFLAEQIGQWGAIALQRTHKLNFDSKRRSANDPGIAFVGVHDMEGRRISLAAGFDRVIESGVGTDLLVPRVSWHSLPGNAALGRKLFPEQAMGSSQNIQSQWADDLKKTPGGCGWAEFEGISATAPAMGLAAVALAVAELTRSTNVSGRATLWSPLLPVLRTEL